MRRYILPSIESFRHKRELWAWRDKEISRWVNGYDGLSGLHYFILSQGTYKRIDGKLVKPYYRDVDEIMLDHFLKCRRLNKFCGIAKRREVGFSSLFAGVLVYYSYVEPGSTSLITTCDPERLFAFKTDKLMPFLQNMHPAFRVDTTYDRTTQNDVYTQIKLNVDYYGTIKEVFSEFFFKNTSKDASFSAKRATIGFYDEIALHPKPKKLITSSRECYVFEGKIKGTLVLGGTIEYDVPEENLAVLRDLVYNSNAYDIEWLLIEGWMGLFMDENGISDREKGMAFIEQEAEKKLTSSDSYAAKAYRKNYPLSWDDALEGIGSTILKEDLNAKIHNRLIELRKEGYKDKRAWYKIEDGMIKFVASETGDLTVIEDFIPQESTIIIGVDTVKIQPQAFTQSHSHFCMAIKDFTRNVYIGWYKTRMFRSSIIVQMIRDIISCCAKVMIMVERNMGDAFINLMVSEGLREYLCLEPAWSTSKGSRKYGYHKNDHNIMDYVITYVNDNIDIIKSPELLRTVANFNVKNDLLNAMTAAELQSNEYRRIMSYFNENEDKKPRPRWIELNGRRVFTSKPYI